MLIDHIGSNFMPWDYASRIIGRIAFPIFCFLLAEGACYTRNPKRYALRLLIAVFLTEPAFDMAFYHRWNWQSNNVMITLLLGFLSLQIIRWHGNKLIKLGSIALLVAAGNFLYSDYGSYGVLLIILFYITREMPYKKFVQFCGTAFLFHKMGGIQLLALFSLIPIFMYSGKKISSSKALQLGFYLFYPVHLWVLYLFEVLL